MTRQFRGSSRRVATAAVLAAVAPLSVTVPAVAAPAPASATDTTAAVTRQYVAVTKQGRLHRLQLVDRASGKVLKTLDTVDAGKRGDAAGFGDVDLAADGSVYAVKWKGQGYGYGRPLVRYSGGRATVIARYVVSVEASPNGKQLAVTIDSPDGDHDGKGLEALRILTPAGKVVRTLTSYAFPVSPEGWPNYEVGGLEVEGWVDARTLVVRTGCCDAANTHLVRADVPRSMRTWPTFHGDSDAMALGVKGSSVLVARPRWSTVGGVDRRAGIEVAWLSSRYPKGKVVQFVKGNEAYVSERADGLVKKYGVTPLHVWPKTFPYRSTGTVLAAHI